jgi:ACR3 family arsenite efflux pump ArsB
LKIALAFWRAPPAPSRTPELFGPFLIHTLTFVILKSWIDRNSTEISFVIYIGILILIPFILNGLGRVKLARLSIAQTFSVMSYSQIYFLPFALISRITNSDLIRVAILTPAFLVQPVVAYRLSSLLVPDDAEVFYGGIHLLHGIALLVWAGFGRF